MCILHIHVLTHTILCVCECMSIWQEYIFDISWRPPCLIFKLELYKFCSLYNCMTQFSWISTLKQVSPSLHFPLTSYSSYSDHWCRDTSIQLCWQLAEGSLGFCLADPQILKSCVHFPSPKWLSCSQICYRRILLLGVKNLSLMTIVAHASHPSTWEAETEDLCEFESSIVYIVSSKTVRSTQ